MLDTEIKELFGKRVREFRKAKGFTQDVLAEKVDIDTYIISNIENGKSFPSLATLAKLIEALDSEPKDLFDFFHHQQPDDIIKEINNQLNTHPDKLKDIYKVVMALTE